VVNVASRALYPFAGLLGGCFIVVDYYLTVVHLAAGHEGRRARATGSACSRPSWWPWRGSRTWSRSRWPPRSAAAW